MNALMSSVLRLELSNGKLSIYRNVTYIDCDDPLGRLTIYSGQQLLDAIPLGDIKKWRFERPRGDDRRQPGTDRRERRADRRQPGTDRRQSGADRRGQSVSH